MALLERQLATVEAERQACAVQLATCAQQLAGLAQQGAGLTAASELLRTLRGRLGEPLSFAARRAVIEDLVARIVVQTQAAASGRRVATVEVVYRFAPLITLGDIAADNSLAVTRVYAGGRDG